MLRDCCLSCTAQGDTLHRARQHHRLHLTQMFYHVLVGACSTLPRWGECSAWGQGQGVLVPDWNGNEMAFLSWAFLRRCSCARPSTSAVKRWWLGWSQSRGDPPEWRNYWYTRGPLTPAAMTREQSTVSQGSQLSMKSIHLYPCPYTLHSSQPLPPQK